MPGHCCLSYSSTWHLVWSSTVTSGVAKMGYLSCQMSPAIGQIITLLSLWTQLLGFIPRILSPIGKSEDEVEADSGRKYSQDTWMHLCGGSVSERQRGRPWMVLCMTSPSSTLFNLYLLFPPPPPPPPPSPNHFLPVFLKTTKKQKFHLC